MGIIDTPHFVSQSEEVNTSPTTGKRLSVLVVWLCAFVSPTAYFVLLIFANKLHAPAPPPVLVVTLFFLIPIIALLVCGRVVWLSSTTSARRIGWMLFTIVTMLLQFGVLLVIVIVAITAAISYAQ